MTAILLLGTSRQRREEYLETIRVKIRVYPPHAAGPSISRESLERMDQTCKQPIETMLGGSGVCRRSTCRHA